MLLLGKSLKNIYRDKSKLIKCLAVGAVIIAAMFRLWNLSENVMFQGDQGRDSLIVARIFKEADFVFIGPVTSVGNMYLGPLYYYFMVPFLWLSYPSPLGPVYAVAILGILTTWLMYKLGKEMVGEKPALLATFIYALSSVAIITTRFSWNPNPVPLVSLLTVYWLHRAYKGEYHYWWLVILGLAMMIQLHYMTLIAVGAVGLMWIIQFFDLYKSKVSKSSWKKFLGGTSIGALLFLLSMVPLLLFDYKHDWLNARAFLNLFANEGHVLTTHNQPGILEKVVKIAKETHGRSLHILFEMLVGQMRTLNTIMVAIVYGTLGHWLLNQGRKKSNRSKNYVGVIVLSIYLLVGVLGTSFYEHTIFDHYIGFLLPISVLIVSWTLFRLIEISKLAWIATLLFLFLFMSYNWPKYPMLLRPSQVRLSDLQQISNSILARVDEDDIYNIVLLSATGDIDGMKYRYFLEASDHPPARPEQRGEVNKLFIINEDRKLDRVVDSPIYEIVVFHDKEPVEVYDGPGWPEITVLEKQDNKQ